MKRKIICLLLAVLCVAAMLAACEKNEGEAVCDAHIDADKNLSCDKCGATVLTIVDKVPTEEEIIEAVVSAIPDATVTTILNCTPEKVVIMPTGAKEVEYEGVPQSYGSNVWLVRYTFEEDVTDDWGNEMTVLRNGVKIFSFENKLTALYTFEDSETTTYTVNVVEVNWMDSFAPVAISVERVENTEYNFEVDTTYYTLKGEKIVKLDGRVSEIECIVDGDVNGEVVYVTIQDTTYAIDAETYEIVADGEKNSFIKRPLFDNVSLDGKYAYVNSGNNILVYDHTKWIECVYCYEISAAYERFDYFVLANGNILVQGIVSLPSSVKNYDYADQGMKYNIDYTLVNVADKTAAPVEFGYLIESVDVNGGNVYAESVKNVIKAYSITNKSIDKTLLLCTDDALAILGELNDVMPNAQIESFELVAENRFLAKLVYGEGSYVYQIYNEKGALVTNLPNNAIIKDSYILVGEKVCDFDLNTLLDLEIEEYSLVATFENYLLVKNGDGDVFYYKPGTKSAVCVVDAVSSDGEKTAYLSKGGEDYFAVAKTQPDTEIEGNTVTTYTVYNADNKKVVDADANVVGVIVENDIFTIMFADGSLYVAK